MNRYALLRGWRVFRIPLAAVLLFYIGLVAYRIPAVREQAKTKEAAEKIRAQKITLADVEGSNLPPEPDSRLRDYTIEGVDANNNGIRDDAERAIFTLHPDSEKIRAAELQYAMDVQSELKWVFNSDTWVAAKKSERGADCLVDAAFDTYADIKDQIGKSDEWRKEIDGLMFNSDLRAARKREIETYETFFATGTKDCDINIEDLPN